MSQLTSRGLDNTSSAFVSDIYIKRARGIQGEAFENNSTDNDGVYARDRHIRHTKRGMCQYCLINFKSLDHISLLS